MPYRPERIVRLRAPFSDIAQFYKRHASTEYLVVVGRKWTRISYSVIKEYVEDGVVEVTVLGDNSMTKLLHGLTYDRFLNWRTPKKGR